MLWRCYFPVLTIWTSKCLQSTANPRFGKILNITLITRFLIPLAYIIPSPLSMPKMCKCYLLMDFLNLCICSQYFFYIVDLVSKFTCLQVFVSLLLLDPVICVIISWVFYLIQESFSFPRVSFSRLCISTLKCSFISCVVILPTFSSLFVCLLSCLGFVLFCFWDILLCSQTSSELVV